MVIARRLPRARLTSQGQITVPKAVRDDLGAKPGDELEFQPAEGGFLVRHRRRPSVLDFAGVGAEGAHRVPQTAEEIDELIASAWTESALRKLENSLSSDGSKPS